MHQEVPSKGASPIVIKQSFKSNANNSNPTFPPFLKGGRGDLKRMIKKNFALAVFFIACFAMGIAVMAADEKQTIKALYFKGDTQ